MFQTTITFRSMALLKLWCIIKHKEEACAYDQLKNFTTDYLLNRDQENITYIYIYISIFEECLYTAN